MLRPNLPIEYHTNQKDLIFQIIDWKSCDLLDESEVVEEEEEEDEDDEEEEDEPEISYVRKKINGKYYFVSDETPSQIYEYIGDNEVGEVALGKMNGKKAEFY